jgi:hypothetical protein
MAGRPGRIDARVRVGELLVEDGGDGDHQRPPTSGRDLLLFRRVEGLQRPRPYWRAGGTNFPRLVARPLKRSCLLEATVSPARTGQNSGVAGRLLALQR